MVSQPGSSSPYPAAHSASLGLYANRVTASVVGRGLELAAADRELNPERRGLVCFAIEGEPGIGKTRLLLAIDEIAHARGFTSAAVTADEEIRGPFLCARSLFSSPPLRAVAEGSAAQPPLERVMAALTSDDDPSLMSMSADRKVMRIFDLASLAVRALASQGPLLLMIDDLQWADEDSIKLLRYIVRTSADMPIVLILASRSDEVALVNEAVSLTADAERMGVLRRLRVRRFTQTESAEFLKQVLGANVNLASAAAMHAQAEGVPFILSEQVVAYRDAGMIQQIDGVWTLAKNAEKLLPSAVKTLIQRRAAHLPEETKTTLGEAAILGRSFSLRDLRDLKDRLSDATRETLGLAEALAPAVSAGLLIQQPEEAAADYIFYHDRVREYATELLPRPRQRAIHAAIVQMLLGNGHPAPESLPLITQHSLAAGQGELCAEYAVQAAANALEAHAPEEVLRMVELAKPVASSPRVRMQLYQFQDDALNMLRRPTQRLEVLASLTALAEASGDVELETQVLLRRAAAFRMAREFDRAAELARRVRDGARERGDKVSELAACKELGQALTRTDLGEAFSHSMSEIDPPGAEEAFTCVADLARGLDDESSLALALRELGVLELGHAKDLIGSLPPEVRFHIAQAIAGGAKPEDLVASDPGLGPMIANINERFRQALEVFDRLGDRQNAMSTIISMAYVTWVFDIHLSGSTRRIEEIRRLATQMKSLTRESERAQAEAQMLFGAHVFALAKGVPDAAVEKGRETYQAALLQGNRMLQFAAAGGVAVTYAELGQHEDAEHWLSRAAEIAMEGPSPLRSRRLAQWRGLVRCSAGDVAGMREQMDRAIKLASDEGLPAARCEALSLLARMASTQGVARDDAELMDLALRSAEDTRSLVSVLPGHPLWGATADAATARVLLHRGEVAGAVEHARAAMSALEASEVEDLRLDILLPSADALLRGGSEEEADMIREMLRIQLSITAARIVDDDVRARWLTGPAGSELTRLAAPVVDPASQHAAESGSSLEGGERQLLSKLAQGLTNRQIAEEMRTTEEQVNRELAALFVKMGANSRADATATAIIGKLV